MLGRTGADQASDGMLRLLAFAAVLLTGAAVLDLDPAAEVPWAHRQLTVLAEDLGAGLGAEQTAALVRLAREMTARNQLRVLAALQEPAAVREALCGDVRAGRASCRRASRWSSAGATRAPVTPCCAPRRPGCRPRRRGARRVRPGPRGRGQGHRAARPGRGCR
ncbi:hypothetical protein ACFQ0M_18445 [Kitasatospora aburaviensis]